MDMGLVQGILDALEDAEKAMAKIHQEVGELQEVLNIIAINMDTLIDDAGGLEEEQ